MNSQAESLEEIYIYCAGGQGRHITFLIQQIGGYKIMGFIDESSSLVGKSIKGFPVFSSIESAVSGKNEINIAIANGTPKYVHAIVKKLREYQKSLNCKVNFPNLIHPSASLNENEVKLGEGNIVNTNVVFTTEIEIGSFNYFNRCCSISHDVFIGDYCFIHAGVHLSGESKVGNRVWFGVNSTIVQVLTVGDDAMIGAGAVILKNVEPKAVMVGNPAKLLRFKE